MYPARYGFIADGDWYGGLRVRQVAAEDIFSLSCRTKTEVSVEETFSFSYRTKSATSALVTKIVDLHLRS